MQLIPQTKIDFLSKRYICLVLSALLLVLSLWSLGRGINRGIDFAGGTEVQVRFAQTPPLDEIRNRLGQGDLGDVSLQQIGAVEDTSALLANVYQSIADYISPSVPFRTLEEMLERSRYVDEIFEGPLLEHAFIDSDELAGIEGKREYGWRRRLISRSIVCTRSGNRSGSMDSFAS